MDKEHSINECITVIRSSNKYLVSLYTRKVPIDRKVKGAQILKHRKIIKTTKLKLILLGTTYEQEISRSESGEWTDQYYRLASKSNRQL